MDVTWVVRVGCHVLLVDVLVEVGEALELSRTEAL